jgi:hypothetical protein
LAITSEVFVANAVLTMQKMTGALLGLLLLLVVDLLDATPGSTARHGKLLGYRRSRENSPDIGLLFTTWRSPRWIGLSAAAVIATLIFLTKYSFGLFYLPGLVAALVTATKP